MSRTADHRFNERIETRRALTTWSGRSSNQSERHEEVSRKGAKNPTGACPDSLRLCVMPVVLSCLSCVSWTVHGIHATHGNEHPRAPTRFCRIVVQGRTYDVNAASGRRKPAGYPASVSATPVLRRHRRLNVTSAKPMPADTSVPGSGTELNVTASSIPGRNRSTPTVNGGSAWSV